MMEVTRSHHDPHRFICVMGETELLAMVDAVEKHLDRVRNELDRVKWQNSTPEMSSEDGIILGQIISDLCIFHHEALWAFNHPA